jgi:bacillithiol system protein YtxJ
MNNGFIDLRDIAALDRLLAQSGDAPVVIFKHSETCGISARAYTEMLKLAEQRADASNETPPPKTTIGIVSIQGARDVSDEIEARMGVEHESPQVFVLRDRKVVWTASHGAVRAEAIREALIAAAGGKQ